MSDDRIEAMRAYGMPDDEIAAILGATEDDGQSRRPRTISEWKNYAREQEARAAQAESALSGYRRRDEFYSLLPQLPDSDREFVTFDDVNDLPELSLTALRVKAEDRRLSMTQQLQAEASARGFPNVETYQQWLAQGAQMAQQAAMQQQENMTAAQAQAGFALGSQPVGTANSIRQEVRQLADEGDLEAVAERVFGNPRAFSRPLGDDFRPT